MIQQSQLTPVNLVYAMHIYYMAGNSIRETAAKFNRSPHGVHKAFRRHNLYIRARVHAVILHNNLASETEAMRHDRQNGMTYQEIADKYHYTRSAIIKRLRGRGK